MADIGYYTLPVMLSFDGVDRQVNSSLTKAFGDVGAKGGRDVMQGFVGSVKASESDVKKALGNYEKLFDKAADSAGKLKVAQAGIEELNQKGITSGQRYERALQAQEKAQRDAARATKLADEALKDYEQTAKSASEAVDDIGDGFGAKLKGIASGAGESGSEAASGFVEGFGGPIAALGTRGGPIGLALAAAAVVAVGAGALIAQKALEGMEQEAAADRIQAQLGLSPDDAALFGQQAGAVYSDNFGESFSDVQQSMADVASTIGASSPALSDITAKALTLRDVFGTEVSESVAFAQNLIVNGLAPDAAGAFDLITAAAQRTPAALRDELPDLLNEYNQYFSGLGFSGQQAFGLMVSSAGKGKLYMDKVGDTLKEVSLLATEIGNKDVAATLQGIGLSGQDVANNLLAGGPQAQAQFQDLIGRLAAIPDKAQQAKAALTLFGTPMEDLGKDKIPQFLDALRNGTTAMDGFEGAAQNIVDTTGDNPLAAWEGAMRDIEMAGYDVKSALGEAFGPVVTDLATAIGENKDVIIEGFTLAGQAGLMFGSMVADSAGVVIGALGSIVGGIGNIVGALKDASAWQEDLFGNDERAAQLRKEAQEAYGWGESMYDASEKAFELGGSLADAYDKLGAAGDKMADTAKLAGALGDSVLSIPDGKEIKISENTPEVKAALEEIGITTRQLPDGSFEVTPETEQGRLLLDQFRRDAEIPLSTELSLDDTVARQRLEALARQYPQFVGAGAFIAGPTGAGGLAAPNSGAGAPAGAPNLAIIAPTRADGGAMRGPGGPRSDGILFWGSNGEHILDAEDVNLLGGQEGTYRFRAALKTGVFGRFANGGSLGDAGGLQPFTNQLRALISQTFPMITDIGGYRSPDGYNEHSSGRALDAMIPNWQSPAGIALGDQVAAWALSIPGVQRVMWQKSLIYADGRREPVPDRGSPTANHMDHVHIFTDDVPAGAVPTATLAGFSSSSYGSSGVGPNGEAGTYSVDPNDVADAEGKVREADAKVLEAEARKREIDADVEAKESARIKADNDVAKAKADAEESRRDLAEAKQGKFTAGKSGGGKAGGPELSEIGSIFGSFLKETTGLDGSLFPDIGALPLVGSLNTLLGALMPGGAPGASAGTSGSPFGLPDVAAPPPGTAASGFGSGPLPGPAQISVDGRTMIGGNVGWDKAELDRERDQNLNRAVARIPVQR